MDSIEQFTPDNQVEVRKRNESNSSIALGILLGVSTGHATSCCTITRKVRRRWRTRRRRCVAPLRRDGGRAGGCRQMRVPSIIKYNLLLHRLHSSVLALSFTTEHDSPPCLSEQRASTDPSDIDIHHAHVARRIAHLQRRLGGVGSVLVAHGAGHILCPIGDEVLR